MNRYRVTKTTSGFGPLDYVVVKFLDGILINLKIWYFSLISNEICWRSNVCGIFSGNSKHINL